MKEIDRILSEPIVARDKRVKELRERLRDILMC
jgi:hypothetical protein